MNWINLSQIWLFASFLNFSVDFNWQQNLSFSTSRATITCDLLWIVSQMSYYCFYYFFLSLIRSHSALKYHFFCFFKNKKQVTSKSYWVIASQSVCYSRINNNELRLHPEFQSECSTLALVLIWQWSWMVMKQTEMDDMKVILLNSFNLDTLRVASSFGWFTEVCYIFRFFSALALWMLITVSISAVRRLY